MAMGDGVLYVNSGVLKRYSPEVQTKLKIISWKYGDDIEKRPFVTQYVDNDLDRLRSIIAITNLDTTYIK